MKHTTINKNNVKVLGNTAAQKNMVFGHGFGTDQNGWKAVTPAFENDYRIVVYDNVGGGASDPAAFSPNKYDTLKTYADDLIDICDALELEDVIMVGHSVSGMISLLASLKRPDLFSKLILVGASPRYLNDIDYVGGFDQATLDAFYAQMATNYFAWVSGFAPAAMANPDKPALAQSFADTLKAIRPDIAQSVARVIFQSDYRSEVPKLDKQTLIVQTRNDIAVPMEVAEYLHHHIKNSTLKVVNAEGHFPHISAPEEVINAIRTFI
jgi:sigma-B regulation protein RsbQ